MLWTSSDIDTLVRQRAAGLSSSLIAIELGTTRNAVIGKANRLGLCRPDGTAGQPRKRRAYPPRAPRLRLARIVREPPPMIDDAQIPIEQRKTLMELREGDCRWPVGEVGDPGFFFCGGPVETGQPYCAGHCARAYQVGNERRPFIPSRNAA